LIIIPNCVNVSRGRIQPHEGRNMENNTRQDTPQPTPRRKRRPRADLAYHTIRCTICRHPHRETIEHDYLHWHSPERIAREYATFNASAVYRHVHATGLDVKRRRNAITSLEFIIEKAESIVPTANEIINAVRACSRLNQQGQWIEPPKRYIVTHIDEHGNPLPTHAEDATNLNSQPKTPHATNVTSPQSSQNQSPTPGIRNWFISLKTKATRLIQSPTLTYFSKPQKSACATPQTATVSRGKIATEASSQLPEQLPVASIALNAIFPGIIPAPLRVTLPMYQDSSPDSDPASVDVPVSYLLL
jgi:hypothetical protein